jgi:hypothetical protein
MIFRLRAQARLDRQTKAINEGADAMSCDAEVDRAAAVIVAAFLHQSKLNYSIIIIGVFFDCVAFYRRID